MTRFSLSKLPWIVITSIILCSETSFGFSNDCKDAITMTAMSKITGSALTGLKRLLNNKDAVDVADWADKVGMKYPLVPSYMHNYLDLPNIDSYPVPENGGMKCTVPATHQEMSECHDKECMMNAISHFYNRLVGDESTASKYPLEYPNGIEFTDADSLRFLIGLLSSLHNPAAFEVHGDMDWDDTMGRISISKTKSTGASLTEAIGDHLCTSWKESHTQFWNGGWTHYQALGVGFYNQVVAEFGTTLEDNIKAFQIWAKDTATIRCQMQNHIKQYPFNFDMKIVDEMWSIAMRRNILKGGVRMAVVLQKVLEAQSAARLRKGSSVKIQEDVNTKRSSLGSGKTSITVICTNILVIGSLLTIGWYILVRDKSGMSNPYGKGAKRSPTNSPSTEMRAKTGDKNQ